MLEEVVWTCAFLGVICNHSTFVWEWMGSIVCKTGRVESEKGSCLCDGVWGAEVEKWSDGCGGG